MYLDCTQGAHDLALRRDSGCAWPGLSTDDQLALGGRRADGYARHSDRSGQWGIKRVRALRTRIIAGGVAVLAMVLAGCTDTPPPTSPPITGTYSPSPTATTTEDLPGPPGYPFPPEAMEYTEAGAIAFINYYVDLLNQTAETLDSEPIRLLSGQECFGCEDRIAIYEADLAAGFQYQGGDITLDQSLLAPQLRDDIQGGLGARINTGGVGSALTVLDASGAPVPDRQYPAYDLSISVEIAWFPGQLTWKVAALSLVVA